MKRILRLSGQITGACALLLSISSGTLAQSGACRTKIAENRMQMAVGETPASVTTDDFNHDGHRDLLIANQGSGTLSMLHGNGRGRFSVVRELQIGNRPFAVATADFNQDGNVDIAFSDISTNLVSVVIGHSDGTFSAPMNAFASAQSFALVTKDFNMDGIMDLATANSETHNVTVAFGSGIGTFPVVNSHAVGNNPYSITSGDFNGDGITDLATANFDLSNAASGDVSILYGDGGGSFQSEVRFAVGKDPCLLTSADFDSDGLTDLAVCTPGSLSMSILKANHSTGFDAVVQYDFAGDNKTGALTIGDFNEDGHLDLATGDGITIYEGNGMGTFAARRAYVNNGETSYMIAVDVDEDHHIDVLAISSEENSLTMLMGIGNGFFGGTSDYAPAAIVDQPSCDVEKGAITLAEESYLDAYSFDNGITFVDSNRVADLTPGIYRMLTRDVWGCVSGTTTVTIGNRPTAPAKPALGYSQPACNSLSGYISVIEQRPDDLYSFDNGRTFQTANDKFTEPGNYSVVIRTIGGCISEATVAVIDQPLNVPSAPVLAVDQPSCTTATGKITITAQSAGEMYSFDDGTTYQPGNTKSGLHSGKYAVVIKSADGCRSQKVTTVVDVQPKTPSKPRINVDYTNPAIPVLTTAENDIYQWFRNNEAIFGAVYRELQAEDAGEYTVTVASFDGCASTASERVDVIVTSIAEVEAPLQLYPNPATEWIHLDLKGFRWEETVDISIVNMQGSIVGQASAHGGDEAVIGVGDYVAGKYTIILKQTSGKASVSFIKK